jgi:hypothetical protein
MTGIAIIGAGVAGATAAASLQRDGYQVTVFDKSRGSGGRISSRQTLAGTVDHGTPYFELTRPETALFVQPALAAGALKWWQPRMVQSRPAGAVLREEVKKVLVGYPAMSSFTRFLLQQVDLVPQARITSAVRTVDGWTLQSEEGQLYSGFDQLIITTPPQQALPLLQESPVLQHQVLPAAMECSWVAVVQSDQGTAVPFEVALFETGTLCRAVRHDAKPGRSCGTVWQLQASPAWSQQYQELPKETVASVLVEAARVAALEIPDQHQAWAHRWLYGFTARSLDLPFLFDAAAGLGVCGDWLLGRTVEDAIHSALQLASTLKEQK